MGYLSEIIRSSVNDSKDLINEYEYDNGLTQYKKNEKPENIAVSGFDCYI